MTKEQCVTSLKETLENVKSFKATVDMGYSVSGASAVTVALPAGATEESMD